MPRKYSKELDDKIIEALRKKIRPKNIYLKYRVSRSYLYKLKKENNIT